MFYSHERDLSQLAIDIQATISGSVRANDSGHFARFRASSFDQTVHTVCHIVEVHGHTFREVLCSAP